MHPPNIMVPTATEVCAEKNTAKWKFFSGVYKVPQMVVIMS